MRLGDIGILAEAIEKSIPEIAKKNGGEDIRHRLKICVSLSQEELDNINRELYEMTNHRFHNDLPEVERVDLDLVGIPFELSVLEEGDGLDK